MAVLSDYGKLEIDLSPLIQGVLAIPESEWVFRSDKESFTTCVVREGSTAWKIVEDQIKPVLNQVEIKLNPGFFTRLVLSSVPAGGYILPHEDDFGALIHNSSLHCHIPLTTSTEAILGFTGLGEANLKVGSLYSMDESHNHYARNDSTTNRIHLLLAHHPHDGILSAIPNSIIF